MSLSTDVAVGDPGHAALHNAERAAINGKPDTFLELTDGPSSFASAAGQFAKVFASLTCFITGIYVLVPMGLLAW